MNVLKRLGLYCGFAALALTVIGSRSSANTITPNIDVTAPGAGIQFIAANHYRWWYTASLDPLSEVHGATGGIPFDSYLTMYDFDGYIAGSAVVHLASTPGGPGDWATSEQAIGITPPTIPGGTGVVPVHDDARTNITFNYLNPVVTNGAAALPYLFTFSLESIYGDLGLDPWSSQDHHLSGLPVVGGTPQGSGGQVLGPTAVPEPAFYQMAGMFGLGGLGLFRFRRKKVAA